MLTGSLVSVWRPQFQDEKLDLKDLPKRLVNASLEDQKIMLKELHERFWHAPPAEMLRLLQAAMLPRDICVMGADVAAACTRTGAPVGGIARRRRDVPGQQGLPVEVYGGEDAVGAVKGDMHGGVRRCRGHGAWMGGNPAGWSR